MKWFKSKNKEKKKLDLQSELDKLNEIYKEWFDKLTIFQHQIVIFKYFFVKNNSIHLAYINHYTLKDHVSSQEWWRFESTYGKNMFREQRNKWLLLKEGLEKFGFEIIKKENE